MNSPVTPANGRNSQPVAVSACNFSHPADAAAHVSLTRALGLEHIARLIRAARDFGSVFVQNAGPSVAPERKKLVIQVAVVFTALGLVALDTLSRRLSLCADKNRDDNPEK